LCPLQSSHTSHQGLGQKLKTYEKTGDFAIPPVRLYISGKQRASNILGSDLLHGMMTCWQYWGEI